MIQPRRSIGRQPSSGIPLPQGLLSVATPLDVAGYKVRIIDQEMETDWEKSLLVELQAKPICVGVTAMTGSQIRWSLKASELVKQNSDVPVVWGGVHASILPQQTLQNQYIDIVVEGEGEETFLELVKVLSDKQPLDKVEGIWYKECDLVKQNPPRSFIDLNQQSPLAYHLIDLKKHMMSVSGRDALIFETSRGCPFSCTFCYNTCFNRKEWRALTAEETLWRLKRVVDEYGVKAIAFSDDNFFASPDRARKILEGMVQQKLGIVWGKGDIRLDLLAKLDDDFLHLMERSGCLSLVVGIESGSQRIANLIRKEINVAAAIAVNRRLARHQMWTHYLFLIGIPGETEADLKETADLMLRLVADNPKATIGVQILVPYPGTEIFDLCVQHGLRVPQKLEEWIHSTWANRRMDYPWLSPERKKLLQMISFCGYFLAKNNTTIFSEVSPLITLVAKLYRPIARKRIQGFHYRFLPELKFAEVLGFKGY